MKLKALKIENFRSIQALEIDLPQVCAIVGPNNSGKSSILEAIRRVLAPEWGPRAAHFSENDVYLREEELDIAIECSFEPPIDYRRLKDADPVEIERLSTSTTDTRLANRPERGSLTNFASTALAKSRS